MRPSSSGTGMWTVSSLAAERSTLRMPSSSLSRMAASSNRAAAATQGFFSFSREIGTDRVGVATVHASGLIMPEAGRRIRLLKQQLGHIGGLAIHRHGDHKLAAPLEGGGQRQIHLVEAGVDALCAGIRHRGIYVSDLDAYVCLGGAAHSSPVKDQVRLRCHVDRNQRAVAGRVADRKSTRLNSSHANISY